MKSLLHIAGLLLITAALAAGCRTSESTPRTSESTSRAAEPAATVPPATTAPLAAYVFDCDGGTSFILAMNKGGTGADEAVDLVLPDRRYRLPRVVAASGAHYAAGNVSVWNKGREATLDLDGRMSRCVENRPRSIVEDARARGVEFRGTGNEPGWVLEILADRMLFIDAYGARRVATPRPARQGGAASGDEVYVAVTEAHRLAVRIRPGSCIDSMSGARHGSGVEVELDGASYRGCGDVLDR
jgi:uncharacterized membrane protein